MCGFVIDKRGLGIGVSFITSTFDHWVVKPFGLFELSLLLRRVSFKDLFLSVMPENWGVLYSSSSIVGGYIIY
jgi:hypothetical protein